MNKILFGTAGVPQSSKKRDTLSGIQEIKDLGLDAMELEFVRGVRMRSPKAKKVRALAEKLKISLTVHGPYYINLASKDKAIREKSIERILRSARIGNICGAKSVTFHSSYFQDQSKEKVFGIVKDALLYILEILEKEGNDIIIAPELTGKPTQFGSLEELINISQKLKFKTRLCLDFAHQHARDGKHNSYKEFVKDLEIIEKELGKKFLKDLHMHVSGIHYTKKGERNHLMLEDSDLKYKELLRALIDKNVDGTLICESPIQQEDALLLKSMYERLRSAGGK